MALRLNGSSSGYVELDVPAAAGSHTLTLPDGGGSSGQYLQTNGSGGLSWQTVTDTTTNYTAGTPQNASGQYQEFTGIDSDVNRITLIFWNLSVNTAASLLMQIGDAGGFETSGYTGTGFYDHGTGYSYNNSSIAWHTPTASPGHVYHGRATIERADTTNRIWVCTWTYGLSDMGLMGGGGGHKQLSGTLDRIRIGWNTGVFDGGTVRLVTEN